VLTTLSEDILDTRKILELYRARWQIELCFKRLKSLLRLGCLPKRSGESARAWIQGKLLTVLLIERLIEEAQLFSPWGFPLTTAQPLARVHRSA
jgi:IS4 transposase